MGGSSGSRMPANAAETNTHPTTNATPVARWDCPAFIALWGWPDRGLFTACRPVVSTGQTSDVRPSDTDGLQVGLPVRSAQPRSGACALVRSECPIITQRLSAGIVRMISMLPEHENLPPKRRIVTGRSHRPLSIAISCGLMNGKRWLGGWLDRLFGRGAACDDRGKETGNKQRC